MELSCPECGAKVLPFRLSADDLMFLCANRKCLFPTAMPEAERFITPIPQLRRGLYRVKTEIAKYKAGTRKHQSRSPSNESTASSYTN